MPSIASKFAHLNFATALLAMSWVTCALADPVIEWVTPPAWLQTETENAPARPGMTVAAPAWLATGRGGKVAVLIGQEQVEIDENSLWEWSGQGDGGVGNAVQGRVRAGAAPASGLAASDDRPGDGSVRLHPNASWMLVLDLGENQSAAEGLALFLGNSGYPVSAAQKTEHASGVTWQIWLDGFMSSAAASAISANLRALAPGIISAAPTRKRAPVIEAKPVAVMGVDNRPALGERVKEKWLPKPANKKSKAKVQKKKHKSPAVKKSTLKNRKKACTIRSSCPRR